jgi:hypothetical protein
MAQMAALLQSQRSMFTANDVKPTTSNADTAVSKENQLENQRRQDKMIELLVKIEKNTADALKAATKSGTKQTGEDTFGIGALGAALAAGLGAIVGYIKGYVTLLGKLAKVLLPEKWIAAIKNGFDAIVDFFDKIGDLITRGFAKIKSLFVFDDASTIGKIITALKQGITKFFAPIAKGIEMIKDGSAAVMRGVNFLGDMISKVKSFFSTVAAWGNEFTKIFSGAVKLFSKLAIPLTVIMTLWDTVKGFIEGFEKGGIIEGVAGAVKGFFNSLIFAPLDMLKNATAWVLGVFGFDKAKAVLESFSFEKMFSELIDTLVKPFIWIKDKAIELWNTFNWDETWASITEFITESIGSVVSGFGKLKDGIVDWWNNWSITDVIDSIANQVSEISSAISKWFADKLDKVKSFFGFGDDKADKNASLNPTDSQKKYPVGSITKEPLSSGPVSAAAGPVSAGSISKESVSSGSITKEPLSAGPVSAGSISKESVSSGSALSKITGFLGFKKTPVTGETSAPVTGEMGAKIAPVTPNVSAVQTVAKSVESPRTAAQVSLASAAAEEAKIFAMKPVTGSSTTAVVNAPVTTVSQNIIKPQIRNQESSLAKYINNKYGII